MVRHWSTKDSMRTFAKSLDGTPCKPCLPNPSMEYQEVGPKKQVVKSIAQSLLHPLDCLKIFGNSKIYWGSPLNCGRSTIALTLKGAMCENFVFSLVDTREFARDNRPDYNCVPPTMSAATDDKFPVPPTIFGKDDKSIPAAADSTGAGAQPPAISSLRSVANASSPPKWKGPSGTGSASMDIESPASSAASPWPVGASALQGVANPLETAIGRGEFPPIAEKPGGGADVAPLESSGGSGVSDAFKELHTMAAEKSSESSGGSGGKDDK